MYNIATQSHWWFPHCKFNTALQEELLANFDAVLQLVHQKYLDIGPMK